MTTHAYPLSDKLEINFSPTEDRLIVRARQLQGDKVVLLLTRRMVIIVLQQLLTNLAKMTELGKTPSEYWQDIFQMAHQQAMQAKVASDDKGSEAKNHGGEKQSGQITENATSNHSADNQSADPIYLATELTAQLKDKLLTLAFKGLSMPTAMTQASPHTPVLAVSLVLNHVHQLIDLLVGRAQEAQWHLPVELPWLNTNQSMPSSKAVRRDN